MEEETTPDSTEVSELVRYSRPLMTTAGVATLIIMIIGVIGNLLTLVALLRQSKLRTVAAAFIASLCISDLMLCFLALPFAASQFFHGVWIHGQFLCTMVPLLRYATVGVSLLSIAIISINRYILIAFPHLYARIYTKVKVAIYIGVIWIFSYGLLIPTILNKWGVFGIDDKLGTCTINKDENGNSPKTALFLIGFALPAVIIVVCYVKIFWVVKKSHERLKNCTTGTNYKRSEMKVTKMVLVIFVCFVVCYLPITMVKIFDPDVMHPPLHIIGYILIYTSACVNPVVYVTMNKQYRQAYLDTLRCSYSSNLESQNTPSPPSKSHMSVGFLKNIINTNPKV